MEKLDFNKEWFWKRIGDAQRETQAEMKVNIPHDAMLREARRADCPGGKNTGYFEGADYLYTKNFSVPAEWKQKKLILEFEGIYHHAEVYINGIKAVYRPFGYTNFYIDLNSFLNYGKDNQIQVFAKNSEQPNSRWYTGAGIYRPVWLWFGEKEYILPSGVKIDTVSITPPVVRFSLKTFGSGSMELTILNDKEEVVVKQQWNREQRVIQITLPGAHGWSADEPILYKYCLTLKNDKACGYFGIRQLNWDIQGGLTVNNKRVILRGACIHHDNGLLGACAFPEAEERKIRILKENGYNAIRCAHNPCSKALLEACDKLGMYVMDEYTDMWYIHKTQYDYADYMEKWWQDDLRDMVNKDYSHPSVIIYSIGNEVAETAQKKGIKLAREMTKYLHELDYTRPVTCGINIFFNLLNSIGLGVYSDKKAAKQKKGKKSPVGSEFYNVLAGILGAQVMKLGATLHSCDVKTRDAFAQMDIAGYNYGILRYQHDLKKYQKRLILGSETFCKDAFLFYNMAKRNPRIIGDFVWAGMDYLGEAGIGAWEYEDYAPKNRPPEGWLTAGSGRIDITGASTGEALYTKIAFDQEKGPRIAVRPVYQRGKHSPSAWKMTDAMESWSWRGCENLIATVEIYTKEEKIALYLNGKFIQEKKRKKDCRIIFHLPYQNGCLVAVAYDKNNQELSRSSLVTANDKTYLHIIPEKTTVKKEELCFVRIRYTDENNVWTPMEKHRVTIAIEGGELIALGNACAYNFEGYLNNTTETYYGEAMAIIKAGDTDAIYFTVTDEKDTVHSKIDICRGEKQGDIDEG